MESVKWFLVRFCEGWNDRWGYGAERFLPWVEMTKGVVGTRISQSLRSLEMTERGGRSGTFKISMIF